MEERKECNNSCAEKSKACIPFFVAENQVMHMDVANKRMLAALISVCITFILTIVIFVFGYTIREKNWLNTIKAITPVTEAQDGVQQQPDQGTDP